MKKLFLLSFVFFVLSVEGMQQADRIEYHGRECQDKCPTHRRKECQLNPRNRGTYYCISNKKLNGDDWREKMHALQDVYKKTCFDVTFYPPDRRKKKTETLPYDYRVSYAKKKKRWNNKKKKQTVHKDIKCRLEQLGFEVESPAERLAALAAAASTADESSSDI